MEYEIDYDTPCPKCGHECTRCRPCAEITCEDGRIDESDDDYMLPGTRMVKCDHCNGHGVLRWCPNCGYDLNFKL